MVTVMLIVLVAAALAGCVWFHLVVEEVRRESRDRRQHIQTALYGRGYR